MIAGLDLWHWPLPVPLLFMVAGIAVAVLVGAIAAARRRSKDPQGAAEVLLGTACAAGLLLMFCNTMYKVPFNGDILVDEEGNVVHQVLQVIPTGAPEWLQKGVFSLVAVAAVEFLYVVVLTAIAALRPAKPAKHPATSG
ncbi:hypothetical protein [Mycobacteroides abscessus]|uniref:Uncharacterized protein n=1 Tax=Mycobacteroides abscessus TaxID=36809 RepID=A0A0U0ZSR8_9MYCO|nr:hypothetical protein [Mycobacteroides abscessus]CPV67141.1 Uncharacterised protein [Mycobacteroides abscessus]